MMCEHVAAGGALLFTVVAAGALTLDAPAAAADAFTWAAIVCWSILLLLLLFGGGPRA